MTLYIGVDIHARQQTLSYLDTNDGCTAMRRKSDDWRAGGRRMIDVMPI